MFFQKNSPNKIPTSKIIYNLIYSDQQVIKKNNLESVLYKRLEKVYKLDINRMSDFIDREQSIILTRGNLLENYLFEGSKTVEETLSKFYSKLENINMVMKVDNNFTNLTFSELAVASSLFDLFESRLSIRQTKLSSAENNEFDADESRFLLERLYTEEMLIKYYKLLKKCVNEQMGLRINYKSLEKKEQTFVAIKELKYLKKQVKEFPAFFKKYEDLTFDVFSQTAQLTKDSNVNAYVFKKRK